MSDWLVAIGTEWSTTRSDNVRQSAVGQLAQVLRSAQAGHVNERVRVLSPSGVASAELPLRSRSTRPRAAFEESVLLEAQSRNVNICLDACVVSASGHRGQTAQRCRFKVSLTENTRS